MTSFETLEMHETEFGNANFLQVARKVAKDDDHETAFIALTRGYTDAQGGKRYKTNLTFPDDAEIITFVAEALAKVRSP